MRYLFIISFLVLLCGDSYTQQHLEPANGANGISGPITGSFFIKWASVDSAIFYEYIMSDNPLCFSGCPGDTRQNISTDTTATEYNLQEGKFYYWITRVYYQNGDTSFWSGVPSSFLAKSTQSEKDEIINVAPNPCLNNEIIFNINWGVNPSAKEISLSMFSVFGVKVQEVLIKKESYPFQFFNLPVPRLTKGVYIVRLIIDDNPNNPNNRVTKKIILQ